MSSTSLSWAIGNLSHPLHNILFCCSVKFQSPRLLSSTSPQPFYYTLIGLDFRLSTRTQCVLGAIYAMATRNSGGLNAHRGTE
ncbi:hypothetical protein EVAR_60977_1 [Eumeta japonica]|uniref:Uncharacterized protein n=1 Tax=Eumeta variegata TaxID=151549 RepID=A0A4C1XUX7_EUMVA|nr:hypothetical protein EVAR_60977_1 [Eumeta japonica]